MIVESIELRNFRHLPFLTIDIPEGTAVIHGNNETGKSTLREAFRLAFSGDPFSSAKGYETLAPWGTKLKAEVTVAFRTADGSRYRVVKSFPKGDASLHRLSGTARDEKDAGALIAEGKGVQEKLDEIIGRGNLETGMSDLLSLSQGETLRLFDRKELPKVFGDEGRLLLKEIVRENLFSGKAERLLGEIGKRKEEIFDTRMNFRKNAVITRLADEYRTMEKTHSALAQKLETEGEKERILAGLEEENRADSVKYSALSDLAKALSAKFDAGADYRNAMDKFSSVKKDHLRILSLHEKNDSNRALLFRTAGEELTRTEGEIAGLRDEVSRLTETEARLAEITAEMKGLNPPAAEQLDLLAGLEDEIRETDTLLSASTVRMEITSPGSEEYEIKADHEEPRRERGNAAVTGSRTIGFRGGPYEIICTGPLPAEEYEKVSKRRELAIREKAGLTKFIGFDSSGEARKVRERYDTLERERSMLTRLLSEKNGPAVKGRISEAAEREKRLRSIIESCPESAKTAARGGAASDRSGSAAGGQRVSADTLLRLIEETERELDRMIGDSSEREITDSYLLLKEETERMARKLAVLPPADRDVVSKEDVNRAAEDAERIRRRIDDRKIQIAGLQREIALSGTTEADIESVRARMGTLENLIASERKKARALLLLEGVIRGEEKRMEREITSPIADRMTEWFSAATGGRYRNLAVSEDFAIRSAGTIGADGKPLDVDPGELSFGAREQISVLFRLAVAAILSEKEPQVLLLDDPFVNTDPGRLGRIMPLLCEKGGKAQIVIFTCHPESYCPFEEMVALIDLEGIRRDAVPLPRR